MKRDSFYVSTPIYYVNDVPHIGHAYTTIAADVLARYHRLIGVPTYFLTGTDEHGQKVEIAAEKANKAPKAFADGVVEHFRTLWQKLNISNDRMIRTTDDDHAEVVADLWKRMTDAGDIYLGDYEDWYCVHDETFWTENQLLDGHLCPNPWCKRPVEKRREQSYFFRLSRFTEPLLEYYEQHPDFVLPKTRMNEVKSFVSQGLTDLSISRTSFSWGLPVPDDPKHVIYVWVDALTNYLTGAGFGRDAAKYEQFWPATVHLIGKDILRFHAIFWPAFLMSAGLPMPEHVLAHGFWTIEGQKMSKSLGNWIDPNKTMEQFGLDPFRFYLMREISLGPDGDFSEQAMVGRINAELANDLGNLLSRSLAMTAKYVDGIVPQPTDDKNPMAETVRQAEAHYHDAFKQFQPNFALAAVWEIVTRANKYIDEQAPWVMAKDEARRDELAGVMYNLLESLRYIALMLWPVMPGRSEEMIAQLGLDWETVKADGLGDWGRLPAGTAIKRGASLFPRVELATTATDQKEKPAKKAKSQKQEKAAKKEKPADHAPDGVVYADFTDFTKLSFKVGVVKSAERVPDTDKLLKLVVDTGEPRTIVAGIAEHYTPDDLIGKRVVVLVNLKPRKLRGILSEGMVLAAKADGVLKVLTIDGELPAGAGVS